MSTLRVTEYGPGEPMPGVIAAERADLLNGATTGPDGQTVVLPAEQWSYGLALPFQHQALPPHCGAIVVELKLSAISGRCGISAVDSSLSTVSREIICDPGEAAVTLTIDQPEKVAGIAIRKVDPGNERPGVIVRDVRAHRLGSERLVSRGHNLGYDLFVVLSPPKTGTQTIERTIQALSARAAVFRIHDASERVTNQRRAAIDCLRKSNGANHSYICSVQKQLDESEALHAEIAAVRRLSGRIAFVTAYREPIDRAISSFFQLLPELIPAYAGLHAVGSKFIELLIDGLVTTWQKEVEGSDDPNTDRLWARCLQYADYHGEEFYEVTGFELRSYEFDRRLGYLVADEGNDTLLALRASDMSKTLPAALAQLISRAKVDIVSANEGSEKSYAQIYNEFLAQFRMPENLVNAIYARSPWIAYFYSPAEVSLFKRRWVTGQPIAPNEERRTVCATGRPI